LLGTNIPWSEALRKKAAQHHIVLIGNTPCIEGLFLALLGHAVPANSTDCKKALAKQLPFDLLLQSDYAKWCTPELLQQGQERLPDLKE